MNGPLTEKQRQRAVEIWGDKGVGDDFKSINDAVNARVANHKPIGPFRFYHFVMYNLSGIQKGIQSYHAGIEYSLLYGHRDEFRQWAQSDKVVIILDGGGSFDILDREKELEVFGIPFASFEEPDLNHSISAVAFLVDERVYAYDPEKHGMRSAREVEIETYLKSFKLDAN